jgi:glutamate 5-kinase
MLEYVSNQVFILYVILENMKRITIKVGSNVLTREDGTLDITRMSALTDQIAELHRRGMEVIVVSSGAVASGRSEVHPDMELDSVAARQIFSAVGQAKLMNRYYDLFRSQGIVCGQVLTTKSSLELPEHYENQKGCIESLLSCGIIPIVNENDTISITELMFTDNDELSGWMAQMMSCDMLIILSNIDGVYDGDPSSESSRLIPEIHPGADDLTGCIKDEKSSFGRGGMMTKCSVALKLAGEAMPVVIANGKRDDVILHIIDADPALPCTRFVPEKI